MIKNPTCFVRPNITPYTMNKMKSIPDMMIVLKDVIPMNICSQLNFVQGFKNGFINFVKDVYKCY